MISEDKNEMVPGVWEPLEAVTMFLNSEDGEVVPV
jgi:hypothetical protein